MGLDFLVQQFIFSRWFVLVVEVAVVFWPVTRNAFRPPRVTTSYWLGWTVGLFFILVYSSLGGIVTLDADGVFLLDLPRVIVSTVGGVLFGLFVIWFASLVDHIIREKAVYVTVLIALSVVVIFLTFFENGVLQRTLGIATVAAGIVLQYLAVFFGADDELETENDDNPNGIPRAQMLQPPQITVRAQDDTANQPALPQQPAQALPSNTLTPEERRQEEIRNRVRNRSSR